MKQVFRYRAGFFSFRKLKKFGMLLSFGTLVLVMYSLFFTVPMEYRRFLDALLKLSSRKHQSTVDEIIKHAFEAQEEQEQPPWKPEYRGHVNMHVFEDWCGSSVGQLRKNVLYPLFPHSRTTVSSLAINPRWKNYGVRIFGYIQPSASGYYIFAISSDNNSEFWLSLDNKPKNLRPLAYVGKTGSEWSAPGEFGKFASQMSKPVLLIKDMHYFFEVIYKQSEGMDHLEVAWRLNQKYSSFSIITSEYLSLYTNESSLLMAETAHIPQTAASQELDLDHISIQSSPVVDMVRADPRDFSYTIPLMNESHLKDMFPECDYKPSYILNGSKMERYQGVHYVRFSAVYPNDYTRQTHVATDEMCFYKQDKTFTEDVHFSRGSDPYQKFDNSSTEGTEEKNPNWQRDFRVNSVDFHSKQTDIVLKVCKRAGNVIMDEKDAMPVVKAVMGQLQATRSTSDLLLRRVLNVERRKDGALGSRYFVELELEDGQGRATLLSRYFYLENSTRKNGHQDFSPPPALCSPKGFSWNPDAKVNVLLTVKNQGRWIIQFIRQMEKIYKATGDKNFNVIIVDFSSKDADIEKELRNAVLPSYQYKRLQGNFYKTRALQAAVDLVEDENSIVFMCDLHLHFPVSIIHSVRKHCVQGRMAFAPVVMRLQCGASAETPTGFWEIDGYGLMGIYKSDLIRVGGMNTEDFKDKWGGEDWELLDRILENKLEVERLNLRNFLHHFHSRRGMWNN